MVNRYVFFWLHCFSDDGQVNRRVLCLHCFTGKKTGINIESLVI